MNLIEAETNFGLSLLQQTAVNESVVFSPLSVILAMTLVHAGAKGNTKDEIRKSFFGDANDNQFESHFSDLITQVKKADNVEFRLANKIYADKDFKIHQAYLDTISKKYLATAETLDFQKSKESAKAMNDFIKDTTKGKISDIIKEDSLKDAVAFIINALYFNGTWQNPFYKTMTRDADFHIDANDKKKIPFLVETDEHRAYSENAEVQLLKLPYTNEKFFFAVILPKTRFTLEDVRKKLTGAKLQELLGATKKTRINIRIPKMKLETELDLKRILTKLGVKQIFTDSADLTAIADNIKISEAKTKATIEVDEQGTVASATTYFKVVAKSASISPTTDFIADHPFIYGLFYDNHPVFMGQFRR